MGQPRSRSASSAVSTLNAPPPSAPRDEAGVPTRALILSLMALAVPLAGAWAFPTSVVEEAGMLLWLTVLVPPFLLTYYRGWKGASVGLAAGMAALVLAHLVLITAGWATPNWPLLLGIVVFYLTVCVGVGILGEVLQRERRIAEANALTDALTGLPNRRHAGVILETAFAAASRGRGLAVILFDVDRFKTFNDTHGHAAGDEVLRFLAEVLDGCTRRMDLSARYGGEEFITILSNGDVDGALVFAERVREEVAGARLPWGAVTVSAGVAVYDESMGAPEILVAAADRALYSAKDAGRDGVRAIDPEGRPVSPDEVRGLRRRASSGPLLDPRTLRGTESRRAERTGRSILPGDGRRPPPVFTDGEEAWLHLRESALRGSGAAGEPAPKSRILLVEDDEAARRAVARLLRRLGYAVLEAPGPSAALRTFQEDGTIALVVTDVIMPDMSGLTMVGRMVEAKPEIRAVYMSGHLRGELGWRGAPGARTAFVEKPMRMAELARKVESVLDGSGTRGSGS